VSGRIKGMHVAVRQRRLYYTVPMRCKSQSSQVK